MFTLDDYAFTMALNPFTWDNAIEDGVSREPFTERTARQLKAGTHVALFGPRGTGKTSFTLELRRELDREHEVDAPPWDLIRVDLRRVISLPAFIGAVSDAWQAHPSKNLRRRAAAAFKAYEKEIGINLGVVKAGVRAGGGKSARDVAEVLHGQLQALAQVSDRLVVVFDEFQRLNQCPGEPLSIIRSALLAPENQGRLSLLITGSLRERVEMMLHTSTEPIWDQTHDLVLPPLDSRAFLDYLEHNFEATLKPISSRAAELLLELTDGHPKRSQHLAWQVWEEASGEEIQSSDVRDAFEALLSSPQSTNFAGVIDAMLDGDETDVNNARALFLISAGESPGSRSAPPTYGFSGPPAAHRALERLRERGIVDGEGTVWKVVDPFFAEWLRRQDPLALLPSPG